jgi:methylmalonyl-CoA/ethylmalonyl-CoA epimerase
MTSQLPDFVGGSRFRLAHLGVAVPELEPALANLTTLFGYRVVSGPFEDPVQKVKVLFLAASSSDRVELELIAPLTGDSPVRAILAKHGGGAYHLCFETPELHAAIEHVRQHGCVVLYLPTPAVAFGGRPIAWVYTPTRQLIELVQAEAE